MFFQTLTFVAALNAVEAGLWTVPEAEDRLTAGGRVAHQVSNPEGVSPFSDDPTSLRIALSAMDRTSDRSGWALISPRPGNLGGLRGPKSLTGEVSSMLSSADDPAAVAIKHRGGYALIAHVLQIEGEPLPKAVQWQLLRAEHPLSPPQPAEAQARFLSVLQNAAKSPLAELLSESGKYASNTSRDHVLHLGPAYPAQPSLTSAVHALRLATEVDFTLISLHHQQQTEQLMRDLEVAALDVICATVSWPAFLTE